MACKRPTVRSRLSPPVNSRLRGFSVEVFFVVLQQPYNNGGETFYCVLESSSFSSVFIVGKELFSQSAIFSWPPYRLAAIY